MKVIENWAAKKLVCNKCGTTKSVKWTNKDKIFCNKCIIEEVLKNNQIKFSDEELFETQN